VNKILSSTHLWGGCIPPEKPVSFEGGDASPASPHG